MAIELSVNGQTVSVQAAADTPLLDVLRNHLNLKGTRYGCGLEQCGTCRVLVDGTPAYACTREVGSVAGRSVTTLEGLGTPDHLHPLQQAFLDEQAGQCGFCLSGILVSAKALLDANPSPSRADIVAAMDRHLCRCGAHPRIIRAIEHPRVTMLGHATGRLLLRREGYRVDLGKVIDAAIAHGVVIELNASPWRLDLDWRHWRKAAARGLRGETRVVEMSSVGTEIVEQVG